jgi:hypothetical protein
MSASGITPPQVMSPKVNDPPVTDWIAIRPKERNGDDEMSKREPIGPIRQKWIVLVRAGERTVNARNPRPQSGGLGNGSQCGGFKKRVKPAKFCFQRKGANSTEHQTCDHHRKPEANGTQVVRWRHEIHNPFQTGSLQLFPRRSADSIPSRYQGKL